MGIGSMVALFVYLLLSLLAELLLAWRKQEKKRRAAALRGAHGDARETDDDEAILHGDLGAILRRQMPGAADIDPP
jgi:hypothetical protein